MTVSAIAAVSNRVGEIQARFERIGGDRTSFADKLQAAVQEAEPTVSRESGSATFAVTPQGLNDSGSTTSSGGLPIGIMGTPILLRPGAANPSYLAAIGGSWSSALPAAGQAWTSEIERAAANAGVDPRLLAAMVWQESGFQPDAVSRSGALGLSQLMPATAEGLGVDPLNAIENLDGGARYLAWTIKEFGSLELGLAAYNAGPGTVRAAGGIPNIEETQAYVPRVMDYYRRLGGGV